MVAFKLCVLHSSFLASQFCSTFLASHRPPVAAPATSQPNTSYGKSTSVILTRQSTTSKAVQDLKRLMFMYSLLYEHSFINLPILPTCPVESIWPT